MKKKIGRVCAVMLSGALLMQSVALIPNLGLTAKAAGIADSFVIPAADANGTIGATVPYTRYDSMQAKIGGGALVATAPDFAKSNIASQASEQSYVRLPKSGSYAEWNMHTTGAGVTVRFTMPDSADGKGLNGSVDVYVNGSKVKTVDLTSYYMWQYFSSGNPTDTNDGGTACFAFGEVHFLLEKSLQVGDVIRIQSSGANGLEYGIDFIEVEEVPDPIEQPANSVSVTDFGAYPDDGIDDYNGIYAAIEYADNNDMDVYIPEGTFEINQIWRLYGSDMMITGAGMWYTNIQFTNPNAESGGISAGWATGGAKDGYCKNIEFCNMYINSNLSSRYNQQAVYKCFMDVWSEGSVIHDIWEEHFECGFWFGDYNGKMDYSDGVKIIDCRIRNNLADGVNFCQGTSNAVVYNCSIRNNGDDGLACWNNSYGNAKDEVGNIFAYNTIDFIWRAGGIAIYGGNGHKIYNNYICDTFMAAGIHLNTTFDGYKFTNNTGISFDNNILVRCGTSADSWGEELGALDVKQAVANVTFNNNQVYDAQHDGVRVLDNSCSNVVFNNTKIFGAGVDGQQAHYSSVAHNGAAIRTGGDQAVFNGLEIANVAWKGENSPYFITGGIQPTFNNVTIYDDDIVYEVPSYPTPDNNAQGGGVVNPLEGITGYDLEVVGLSWKNEEQSASISNNDKVTFTAAIRNTSNVDIPAGVAIGVKITVDDKGSYTYATYKDGLKAGATIALSPAATWTATKGGHTFCALVDYQDKLPEELSESNNTREKCVNVKDSGSSSSYTKVTGGYDLYVTDISYGKDTIDEGEEMTFSATVVNAGDTAVPAGTVIGVQFQVDGDTSDITWCDTYKSGLKAGEKVILTANGGISKNTWKATKGNHTITAWVDDVNRFASEVNESNNLSTISITVPYGGIVYFEKPDGVDNLDDLNNIWTEESDWVKPEEPIEPEDPIEPEEPTEPEEPIEPEEPTEPEEPADPEEKDYVQVYGGYDLYVTNVKMVNDEANAGDAVTFVATVVNAGDREIPAGTVIGAQFQVDGRTDIITWCDSYASGLKPGEYAELVANGGTNGSTWKAVSGTHNVTAWVDDINRLANEVNESNNKTTVTIEIGNKIVEDNPIDYVQVYGGYDLYITDISYNPNVIYGGNAVQFSAKIVNAGDTAIPAGTVIGAQFQVDGRTDVITWSDSFASGLQPGEYVVITANGGTYGNTWNAVTGTHTITAWVDDVNRLPNEVNENNNKTSIDIVVK